MALEVVDIEGIPHVYEVVGDSRILKGYARSSSVELEQDTCLQGEKLQGRIIVSQEFDVVLPELAKPATLGLQLPHRFLPLVQMWNDGLHFSLKLDRLIDILGIGPHLQDLTLVANIAGVAGLPTSFSIIPKDMKGSPWKP